MSSAMCPSRNLLVVLPSRLTAVNCEIGSLLRSRFTHGDTVKLLSVRSWTLAVLTVSSTPSSWIALPCLPGAKLPPFRVAPLDPTASAASVPLASSSRQLCTSDRSRPDIVLISSPNSGRLSAATSSIEPGK